MSKKDHREPRFTPDGTIPVHKSEVDQHSLYAGNTMAAILVANGEWYKVPAFYWGSDDAQHTLATGYASFFPSGSALNPWDRPLEGYVFVEDPGYVAKQEAEHKEADQPGVRRGAPQTIDYEGFEKVLFERAAKLGHNDDGSDWLAKKDNNAIANATRGAMKSRKMTNIPGDKSARNHIRKLRDDGKIPAKIKNGGN